MGGIFPACRNLDDFWQLLQDRRTTARPLPPNRSGKPRAQLHHPHHPAPDKFISPYACLLDDSLLANTHVPEKFGRDPLVTLTLAATQQALDDTRSWPHKIDRHTTNVIIGHVLLPTEHSSKLSEQFYFPDKYVHNPIDPCNRYAADLPAIAIQQHFALHGDRFCLDAACASTLYALKLAMDDLLAVRASTVICGGVLRADGLYPQMGFTQLQALSPRGRCLPFTAEADGLLVGEGAGIFVLKRLHDALAEGDRIHGIIRAVGLSNDVQGNILAPDRHGQLQAMHNAYRIGGVSPSEIDYIECHATGAPRGDTVEIASLAELFCSERRAKDDRAHILGTVKGNIGHLLTAAGAAGLAKILLSLHHNSVPPNIGAHNPASQLVGTPFIFSDRAQRWESAKNKPRCAALSGFGFGGINAHLIVEEYRDEQRQPSRAKAQSLTSHRLVRDTSIAVIGIAAHCGALTDVAQLQAEIFAPPPITASKHIAASHAPLTRYRLPPAQIQEMLPQQLLMLNTACAAADMVGKNKLPASTGIYIGLGLDCHTGHFFVRWQQGDVRWPPLTYGRTLGALGSIVASRIARVLACNAPAFTVSSDASSGLKACALACAALHAREITTAIVGAVDFACHPLNIYARGPNPHGYGDAACALVLKPLPAAQRDHDRVLAIISTTADHKFRTIGTTDSIVRHRGDCGYAHGLLELTYGIMCAARGEHVQVRVRDRDGYTRLVHLRPPPQPTTLPTSISAKNTAQITLTTPTLTVAERTSYSYQQCLTFARGRAAAVLGEKFAAYDRYPVRVRLPDEPLLLCHRILHCDGQEQANDIAAARGYVQTAHDVRDDAWYLDHHHIPLSIAVEAGQADLFLCSQLGIDFLNRGQAVYRLLDAEITCAQPLPSPPATIIYDINIDRFFKYGTSWFFNFRFTAKVDGELLLEMANGCAGFFTAAQLAAGRGIPRLERRQQAPPRLSPTAAWPLTWSGNETYDASQLAFLRAGQLGKCFGSSCEAFNKISNPCRLPHGRMQLIDRITALQAEGGDYGNGLVVSEHDIVSEAWYLTCHFVDDRVMPGTLMYECALQTLRVYTMRRGWVCEAGDYRSDAVAGVKTTLKCRGQVTDRHKTLRCAVHLKTSGGSPAPFCIADAYLYVDGMCAVSFTDMSLQLTDFPLSSRATAEVFCRNEQILQFAEGDPTRCFGERYAVFRHKRKVARLPRPPYKFLDRIVTASPQPAEFTADASCTAEYDLSPELAYLTAQGQLPFCLLLEIGLQPCGWLAAYIGCALQSEQDLSFRNLDGRGTQHQFVSRGAGTLTTEVRLTRLVQAMGMILCNFSLAVSAAAQKVYTATTGFGFFTPAALAAQTGIGGVRLSQLPPQKKFPYPLDLVDNGLRMIDTLDFFDPCGGVRRLGLVRGHKLVDARAWFFRAHFYQDPVVPGSLGLESLLQLYVLLAREHWGTSSVMALGYPHLWSYRGQVVPTQTCMTTQLEVTAVDQQRRIMRGDGLFAVDGLVIYRMTDFAVEAADA